MSHLPAFTEHFCKLQTGLLSQDHHKGLPLSLFPEARCTIITDSWSDVHELSFALLSTAQPGMRPQIVHVILSAPSGQTEPASSASRQAQPPPGCRNQTVPAAAAPKQAKDEAPAPQTPVSVCVHRGTIRGSSHVS